MAGQGTVENLCDETTCPICLEYFKDPVILDCGHNFCRACLTQNWKGFGMAASCPVCREKDQRSSFRPNRQLANVVELVKKLKEENREEGKRGVCKRHQEPLKLFCKDDEVPICVVCDRSKQHREHAVVPVEEAAQEYQEKIQAQLQTLKKKRDKAVDQKMAEEQKSQKYLTELAVEKQKINFAFENMQKFLEGKQRFLLARLGDLETEIKRRQEESVTRFSAELSILGNLIKEMEEKYQDPTSEFLQDIRNTLSRCQKGQVKQKIDSSSNLEERLRSYSSRNSIFDKALERSKASLEQVLNAAWNKEKETQSMDQAWNKVKVILDPETANPSLILSEDLKSVRRGFPKGQPNNTERFDTMLCVLGRERFTSGRHSWEVEVQEEQKWTMWLVGVARESVKRKGFISLNPAEGIWAVGKTIINSCSPDQILAFTSESETPVTLRKKLRKIRVSLDCEKGCVEFFHANTDILIFTFISDSFSRERICPFFLVDIGVRLKC
ncbi:zinc finger protein RFP-like isoform X2 [Hemicordylus capensis]|uniref:zinc finger protein RFP-like isoform X2 n=1 Tax=Hemicordylus capensis TaxID=884348 RepID=UPI002303856C|nr:zinc finger protein RFP-like isoform X2 [Hemicordylus capensis]